jgi:hypothetical protein
VNVTLGALALLVLVVVTAALITGAVVAAPWSGGPASARDHARIAWAMIRFDFWLEWNGVSGRRRRDLRDELRGNLYEATRAGSSAQAVAALGPARALAAAYAQRSATGRDWARGAVWATGTLLGLVIISLAAGLTWVDAVLASGAERVDGHPWASPWLHLELSVDHGESFAVTMQIAGWVVLLPVLALLLGAKVWRSHSPRTTPTA